MNAAITQFADKEPDYKVEFRHRETPSRSTKSNSPRFARKRGKQPQSFNGIHRRRKKRVQW